MLLLLAFLLTFRLTPPTATDFKQPQIAASANLVAATFGSGNAIYFSASRDRGNTFSDPVKVAEPGVLSLGMHRGPRIAITPSAIVITAIAGVKGKGADGDLLAWRSADGGKTWSLGRPVNDVPGAAREGLHAMASSPNGLLYAAWLDLRAKGTKLYGASSSDNGATWSKNALIYESPDGAICQCCHPSVAIDAHGTIYAMWRNALAGSRDLYLASSRDGGKTFGPASKLGGGTWPLNACPMDGGGLAITAQGKVISVWRRASDVYLAPEDGAETLFDAGKNPSIAANADGVYAAWSSSEGLRIRVPGKPEPVLLDPEGSYAQLAAIPNGPIVAAWEKKGSIQFQVLR
ncbi:MAG: glycoside hydrolase [Acidobacteriota bacterium]|nr:glycoside hydrolase [Acidobacteriota bacterium]